MKLAGVFAAALMVAAPALAQPQTPGADPHAGHAMEMQQAPAQSGARNPNLPPDNAAAPEQLKSSPRHVDWVDVKGSNGTPIKTFVVYPERKDAAPVVIVIHEVFGLSDWVRGVADQLAKEGFIAVAPDLLSGMGPNKGGSQELGEQGATRAIGALKDEDKIRILNDVRTWALTIPSSNGKLATIGFCWGGGTSFLYALNQPAVNAAVSYYGPMPDTLDYSKAKAAILGLYAGNDNRVNSGIDKAKTELANRKVTYEPHIFDGAGHGFLRQQSGNAQAPGNAAATEQAWPLTLDFLRKYTK